MARGFTKWTIGIDEVGRGALAGPVVVAAALVPNGFKLKAAEAREVGKLKDSKKLSVAQRERWFDFLKDHPQISFKLARVYPRRIEALNISGAANLAAFRAFERLSAEVKFSLNNCKICLDGGLFLKSKAHQPANARTIVKGDEKVKAVAIASIFAKVSRDRFMKRLAKKYAAYGFDIHKGYATKAHRKAIEKEGPSPVHRLTFLPAKYTLGA